MRTCYRSDDTWITWGAVPQIQNSPSGDLIRLHLVLAKYEPKLLTLVISADRIKDMLLWMIGYLMNCKCGLQFSCDTLV